MNEPDKYYRIKALITQLTPKEVEFYGGGQYTTQDIKIKVVEGIEGIQLTKLEDDSFIMQEPVELHTVSLRMEDVVLYTDSSYRINRVMPYEKRADFNSYLAKRQVVDND